MTARAKFTPGPLVVDEGPEQRVYVALRAIAVGSVLIEPPRQPRERIALARMVGDSYTQNVIDATLFAAAPELFAALDRVFASYRMAMLALGQSPDAFNASPEVVAARAALAKVVQS